MIRFNGRMLGPAILVTLLLVGITSPGHTAGPQGFGSSLIPCPNVLPNSLCGDFYSPVAGPEPLNSGTATTQLGGPGGNVKVKVDGAKPNVTYEVRMLSALGPPPLGFVVGYLTTDSSGDGSGTFALVPGERYLSGVQLWRNSDGASTAIGPFFSDTDPRIVTAFIP